MRLRLSTLLLGSCVLLGCFDDPPPNATSGEATDASTSAAGDSTSTSATRTESGGERGSTSVGGTTNGTTFSPTTTGTTTTGSTTGIRPNELLLFPLTCSEATWQAGRTTLPCETPKFGKFGPFVDTHEEYELGGESLERVIEARPPNTAVAALDGIYEIDTTQFDAPEFRSRVACAEGDCGIDFLITAEVDGAVVTSDGDGVTGDGSILEVSLELPSAATVIIHLNLNAPQPGSDNRLLWIDPRVVDVAG